MLLLGYSLDFPDMDVCMLDGVDLPECAKFSDIYTMNIINPFLKFKNKPKNISSTYDGYTIVSEKFKDFCISMNYDNIKFIELPSSPNYYWFIINNVLEFDAIRRETEFINYDENCFGYEEIIGATPICLKDNVILKDGFYRTDLSFGSFYSKSPVEIVGIETMKKLKEAGFKEIFFEKILNKYDWEKQ